MPGKMKGLYKITTHSALVIGACLICACVLFKVFRFFCFCLICFCVLGSQIEEVEIDQQYSNNVQSPADDQEKKVYCCTETLNHTI